MPLCFIVELLKWRWLYISIKIYKKNNQLGTLYIQYSIKLKTFSFDKFFLLFSTARAYFTSIYHVRFPRVPLFLHFFHLDTGIFLENVKFT